MAQQKIQSNQLASSGDVTGPAGAVAGNVVTFNGSTGKIIQDSGVNLANKANLASPTFTGTPAAPTATVNTNTTQIATTAFVMGTHSFNATQTIAPSTLTVSGGSVAVNAALSNNFSLSLTANATLANPTNLLAGTSYTISIAQTGSFTLAFGSLYKFAGAVVPSVSTGAGAKDLLCAYYDGSVLLCSLGKGYA